MNDEDSPERLLFRTVLMTYFSDLPKYRYSKQREQLLKEVESRWTEYLCELAGYDFPFFRDKFKESYNKLK